MALLQTLIRTQTPAPPKMIVYGQPGVGKTTFAASAGAILIDCENGAGAIPDLSRTPYLKSWTEIRNWLVELAENTPKDLQVLAVDTLDWMVTRIVEYVIVDLDPKSGGDLRNTIGSSHGGYFKARDIVNNVVYRDLIPLLNTINAKGIAIVLLAHASNEKMKTPEGFDIRLAAPDLPNWILPTFVEWCDAVLYATRDGNKRTLRTEGTNVVMAKNRYGLPAEIEFSWPVLMEAMYSNPTAANHVVVANDTPAEQQKQPAA